MMAKAPDLSGFIVPRKGEAKSVAESEPRLTPQPSAEVRTTVSTRLTVSVQERLRRYAYEAHRDKQSILEDALSEYLKAQGY